MGELSAGLLDGGDHQLRNAVVATVGYDGLALGWDAAIIEVKITAMCSSGRLAQESLVATVTIANCLETLRNDRADHGERGRGLQVVEHERHREWEADAREFPPARRVARAPQFDQGRARASCA